MRIHIYYGGRGLVDDPTIYVVHKIQKVLQELRVQVEYYALYEEKNEIMVLPQTLKEADAIILATTVEWFGIGGYMQQFLDACWLYGDKEKIKQLYMMPVVITTASGERLAETILATAWEKLGGISLDGIRAYVEEMLAFETNELYEKIIEQKAETLYRVVNQKRPVFPNSYASQEVSKSDFIEMTPQESEQLSIYASDQTYVKKQKEDIAELTEIFEKMLGETKEEDDLLQQWKNKFHPQQGVNISFSIETEKQEYRICVNGSEIKYDIGKENDADIRIKASEEMIQKIRSGECNLKKAFLKGDVTVKGDFGMLDLFDQLFF